MLGAFGGLFLIGCAATPPPPLTQDATIGAGEGDWDDVTAGVFYAAQQCEMALVTAHDPEPKNGLTEEGPRRVYELLTIRDEPVVFQVTRLSEARTGAELRLGCRVGAFGDPQREARFIEAFKRRLGVLEDVEVAPIR